MQMLSKHDGQEMAQRLSNHPSAAVEVLSDGGAVRIVDIVLPRRPQPGLRTPPLAAVQHIVLDEPTLRAARFVARALRDGSPLLLSGPTSTAKTAVITLVAALANWDLYRLNLSPQTDVGELVGRWEPSRAQGLTLAELEIHAGSLSATSQAVLDRCRAGQRDPDRVEEAMVCRAEGWDLRPEPGWTFAEGPLVQALRHGGIVLLDEVSLCPSAVVERVNSVLERPPTFVLTEGAGLQFGGLGLPVHSLFRVAATMNPDYAGRSTLSPAFLNRFTATCQAPAPQEVEYQQMLAALVYGQAPKVTLRGCKYQGQPLGAPYRCLAQVDGLGDLLRPLAIFHAKLELLTRPTDGQSPALGGQSRQQLIYTRRDLLAVVDQLAQADPDEVCRNPRGALLEAIEEVYLQRLAPEDRRRAADVLEAIGLSATVAVTKTRPLGELLQVEPSGDWQTFVRPKHARPMELAVALRPGETLELSCAAPEGAAPDEVCFELFRDEQLVVREPLCPRLRYTSPEGGAYWARAGLVHQAPHSGELQLAYRVRGGRATRCLCLPPAPDLVTTVDGALPDSHGCVDYMLDCRAGHRYGLSTSPCSHGRAGELPGSAEWDTVLEVLGADGKVLASDDDGGVNRTSKLSFTAREDGPHTVRVRGFRGEAGPFRLSLRSRAVSAAEAECHDLTLQDERQHKRLFMHPGGVHRFTFSGRAGEMVMFSTAPMHGPTFPASLRLLAEDDAEIGVPHYTKLLRTLPADGRYTVEVASSEGAEFGPFTLTYRAKSPSSGRGRGGSAMPPAWAAEPTLPLPDMEDEDPFADE